MATNYGINDIETLSFKDGVRKRIAMYLGSADMQGVYNSIQEIISNSIDEFYMGFGKEIKISLDNNTVVVKDFARGVPFGKKSDGTNVLVDIYSKPHTGGKFNDKVYNGQPFEILEVERKDKIVEGYTSNLELNPDYKPVKDNSEKDEIVL